MATAFVTAFILVFIAFRFIPSPQAKIAEAQYEKMKQNYDVLVSQAQTLQQQMASLENRDNQVYRSIFEANPLPDSARAKLSNRKMNCKKWKPSMMKNWEMSLQKHLNNLSARVAYQFDQL